MRVLFIATYIQAVCLLSFRCTDSSSYSQSGLLGVVSLPVKKPPIDPALESFLKDYERYFSDSMQQTGPPGAALAIVKENQVILAKGYGVRAAGGQDAVNEFTVFRIGSLSKGFAGVLTGILVQNGCVGWQEPVRKFYPDFLLKDKSQAQRVQVYHLLSHTTGLPYQAFGNLIEQGFHLTQIVRQYFPTSKLGGKEGEFFGYQNAAFCVIEPVLSAATGKTYQELLRENIFQPANMTRATCTFDEMMSTSNKAMPHSQTEAGWMVNDILPNYYHFAAAGGMNASIADMGEWLLLLLGQKPEVVADSTLDRVFIPVVPTGKERHILPGWIHRDSASYALGWRILQHDGDTLVYHSGYVNNYHSEIAFNRRDKIGICVLFNGNTPLKGACIREFFERWKKTYREGRYQVVE